MVTTFHLYYCVYQLLLGNHIVCVDYIHIAYNSMHPPSSPNLAKGQTRPAHKKRLASRLLWLRIHNQG